jgi:hypothetical protein
MARTVKSTGFDPALFFDSWAARSLKILPQDNDLQTSIIQAFGLKDSDDYIYHATASVTLAQVQHALNSGAGKDGILHAWYKDSEGKQVTTPFQ